MLSTALRGYRPRRSALQPPDQAATDDQTDRDQLGSGHHSAEDFTSAGVAAQKLDEVTFDSVKDHETGKHLAIELLALEHPHQENKVEELGCRFDQLRWFQSLVERGPGPTARYRVLEDDTPEIIGVLAVTASC